MIHLLKLAKGQERECCLKYQPDSWFPVCLSLPHPLPKLVMVQESISSPSALNTSVREAGARERGSGKQTTSASVAAACQGPLMNFTTSSSHAGGRGAGGFQGVLSQYLNIFSPSPVNKCHYPAKNYGPADRTSTRQGRGLGLVAPKLSQTARGSTSVKLERPVELHG